MVSEVFQPWFVIKAVPRELYEWLKPGTEEKPQVHNPTAHFHL